MLTLSMGLRVMTDFHLQFLINLYAVSFQAHMYKLCTSYLPSSITPNLYEKPRSSGHNITESNHSFKNYAIIWCKESQVDDSKPICEGWTNLPCVPM